MRQFYFENQLYKTHSLYKKQNWNYPSCPFGGQCRVDTTFRRCRACRIEKAFALGLATDEILCPKVNKQGKSKPRSKKKKKPPIQGSKKIDQNIFKNIQFF